MSTDGFTDLVSQIAEENDRALERIPVERARAGVLDAFDRQQARRTQVLVIGFGVAAAAAAVLVIGVFTDRDESAMNIHAEPPPPEVVSAPALAVPHEPSAEPMVPVEPPPPTAPVRARVRPPAPMPEDGSRAPTTDELLGSAQEAMAAKRDDDAQRALKTLIERHPRSEQATLAHFYLGRMAARRSEYGEAVTAYRDYLGRAPKGSLAREVSGRLLEALVADERRSEARKAARAYLDEFPRGPHAALARRTLEP